MGVLISLKVISALALDPDLLVLKLGNVRLVITQWLSYLMVAEVQLEPRYDPQGVVEVYLFKTFECYKFGEILRCRA